MLEKPFSLIKRVPKCYFLLIVLTLIIIISYYVTQPELSSNAEWITFASDGNALDRIFLEINATYVINASDARIDSDLLAASDVGCVIDGGTRVNGSALHSFYSMFCDRKSAQISDACLSYANFDAEGHMNRSSLKLAMTLHDEGRLGNVIGQYATLWVLSKLNGRPALQTPRMANFLRRHFHVQIPVMSPDLMSSVKWTQVVIQDRMEESYKHFRGPFLHVGGYPSSYTFFEGFEEELRREFRFKDTIQERAERVLRTIGPGRTFVGVHVRRGDYVKLMRTLYHGVLADRKYFSEATDYFRAKYSDVAFVVVSNDMQWCVDNINNDRNDVFFVGNNNESDPIVDFATMVNCNHSIITIGTFSFFGALFAGGDTVYFTKYTVKGSLWGQIFKYDSAFPKRWHPIEADLTQLEH